MKIHRFSILNILLWFALSLMASEQDEALVAPVATPTSGYQGGFFLGGGGGIQRNITSFDDSTTVFVNRLMPTLMGDNEIRTKPRTSEGNGALYFGYGVPVTNTKFYLSMQLGLNFGKFNAAEHNEVSFSDWRSTVDVETTVNAKMNTTEFFADFKPGLLLREDILVSALVGFALNEAKMNYTSTSSSDHFLPVEITSARTKSVIGLRVGASVEKLLWDSWSVGVNYIYTKYGVGVKSSADQLTDERWPMLVSKSVSSKFRKRSAMVTVSRYFT